jgi:hypothetical protein
MPQELDEGPCFTARREAQKEAAVLGPLYPIDTVGAAVQAQATHEAEMYQALAAGRRKRFVPLPTREDMASLERMYARALVRIAELEQALEDSAKKADAL